MLAAPDAAAYLTATAARRRCPTALSRSARLLTPPREEQLPRRRAIGLAVRCAGHLVHNVDLPGKLVAGEAAPSIGEDVLGRGTAAGAERDHGAHALAEAIVGHTENEGVFHVGVPLQRLFQIALKCVRIATGAAGWWRYLAATSVLRL